MFEYGDEDPDDRAMRRILFWSRILTAVAVEAASIAYLNRP
jgi:hypothetical protein